MTLLLYLNGAPPGAVGGDLACFCDGGETVRVAPKPGRLVAFEARKLQHAVEPVDLWRRVALSLWCLRDGRAPPPP